MTQMNAGAALFLRLKAVGVDFVFANSGTDFPPIIEGLAEAAARGRDLPLAVTVPHETAAVAMAHGAYFATGRAQAVMVHTNVGLANAAIGVINARADNVPMLVFSGRTPTTEKGRFGSRTVPIGWGQEMADQTALVREASKWDYELRFPEQVSDLVDRAHAIAHSTPYGPTYISLPREVLCETIAEPVQRPQMRPAQAVAPASAIAEVAQALARAKNPVIFAQRGAGSAEAFAALSAMVERWAIPVCQYWAIQCALPTDHPMAAGHDPAPLLAEADVILCLDALAPWAPDAAEPAPEATVIQIGQDPLFAQTPIRNFRADVALAGDLAANVLALCEAMAALDPGDRSARYDAIARRNADDWAARDALIAQDGAAPHLTKRWISDRVATAVRQTQGTVFGELGAVFAHMRLDHPAAWFDAPHSGGLGYGMPAAMGFKMGAPERTVFAVVGDGSYMFANPVACHQVAEALGLSLVVIVVNNAEWGAVRASVQALYPDGHAVASNAVPLTGLSPSPDFTSVAGASRHWARAVDTHEAFDAALAEAIDHVQAEKGLALIEARVAKH